VPNIVPTSAKRHAVLAGVPLSWQDARNAARAASKWKDGSRRVRYVNPITGGSTMPLMDCYLVQRQGHRDGALRTTSNAVCLVCGAAAAASARIR
jgi:gentisate 1,2-dioxygenase